MAGSPAPFPRRTLTADDWRFRGALLFAFTLVGGLTLWARNEEVVELEQIFIPERMLELVLREPPDPTAPDTASSAPRAGGRGSPALNSPPTADAPVWSSDGSVLTPYGRLFRLPTFGTADQPLAHWDASLDQHAREWASPELRERPRFAAQGTDDGREDATLPMPRLDAGPSGVVTVAAVANAVPPPQRALVVPSFAPSLELPSAVVQHSLREWRRHAHACWTTRGGGWSGRVELRVQVVGGRVDRVRLDSALPVPDELARCFRLRARHLLRFPSDAHGEARLPFVLE